jgi:hypothetical protein
MPLFSKPDEFCWSATKMLAQVCSVDLQQKVLVPLNDYLVLRRHKCATHISLCRILAPEFIFIYIPGRDWGVSYFAPGLRISFRLIKNLPNNYPAVDLDYKCSRKISHAAGFAGSTLIPALFFRVARPDLK